MRRHLLAAANALVTAFLTLWWLGTGWRAVAVTIATSVLTYVLTVYHFRPAIERGDR